MRCCAAFVLYSWIMYGKDFTSFGAIFMYFILYDFDVISFILYLKLLFNYLLFAGQYLYIFSKPRLSSLFYFLE